MNVLTSFPFTFKLTIPGLSNPFYSLTSTSPTTGTNPPRLPPLDPAPPQPDFSDPPSRSFARPTRPLPISLGQNTMLSSRNLREPQASYSPSSSPGPHSYTHLAPKLQLSAYEEWLQQSQSRASPAFQSHSPSPGPPVSRKRGWESSFSSPCGSEATLTSTSGYLAKSSKYQDLTDRMDLVEVDRDDGTRELDSDDMPPAKRRRGLTGSLVSTAWSAALLGTAVGLSVYRFWKGGDQADNSQQEDDPRFRKRRIVNLASDAMSIESPPPSPPPPYTSSHEWTAVDYPRALQLSPRRDKGKSTRVAPTPRSSIRRATLGTRAAHTKPRQHHHHPPRTAIPRAGPSRPPANEAFDFSFNTHASTSTSNNTNYTNTLNAEADPETDDVDEQMDWIGGKLAELIEEGKKALGKEVVVMSEAREDEEDDGSGAWVSDGEDEGRRRRSGSIRRRGSTASSKYNPSSLGRRGAAPSLPTTTHTTPQRQTHAITRSFDEPMGGAGSESPEVREMMERARAKFAGRTMAR